MRKAIVGPHDGLFTDAKMHHSPWREYTSHALNELSLLPKLWFGSIENSFSQ